MTTETIRRYGTSLYEVLNAAAPEDVSRFFADTDSFLNLYAAEKELSRMLISPAFSVSEKIPVLSEISAKQDFGSLFSSFICLLAENRKIEVLTDIIDYVKTLVDKRDAIINVSVVSADPLDKEEIDLICEKLKKRFNGRKVNITTEVDPSILAGCVVRRGSRFLDGSLRGLIDSMRKHLMET